MTSFDSEYIQTKVGNLHVTTSLLSGAEPSLIFWPGLFFDGTMWDDVAETFRDRFNIVIIDPPGHGRSEAPRSNFEMLDCADASSQILIHYNLKNCVFIGLSWGGFVAQSFLKHHASQCSGVVLINTCTSAPTLQDRMLFTIIPKLLALLGPKHFEASLCDALLSKSATKNRPELVARIKQYLGALNFSDMHHVFNSVMKKREDLENCIAGTKVPCLVVFGTFDASIDKQRTQHMISSLPPETPAVELATGHNAVLEASDQVCASMETFLTSIPR